MARKDTIFERFLAPVVRLFIDEPALQHFYDTTDWQREIERFRQADLSYPPYYLTENFHGIDGGYLTPGAAVSYDPITHYALAPGESLVRQGLIEKVQGRPRRILDLGCGTGSTTLMLKQAFPQAEVVGLDLSPYMLFMAERKAGQAGVPIQFLQANAEQTHFPEASFDLVSASLLFHETPVAVSQAILKEAYRLLTEGGQVLILDGHQKMLRQLHWLNNIFEEPYIEDYAAGSLDAWLGAAGFGAVRTEDQWWIHQITCGIKPLVAGEPLAQRQVIQQPLRVPAAVTEIPGHWESRA
ncbi:MAG TPA: class I SAM-dependent methyltransferase [Candidatus Caenarcaniphilales bacterium]